MGRMAALAFAFVLALGTGCPSFGGSGGQGASCSSPFDCKTGCACLGKCVCDTGPECATDSNCVSSVGARCISGHCSYCDTLGCAAPLVCVERTQLTGPARWTCDFPPCDASGACTGTSVCRLGRCLDRPTCSSDASCLADLAEYSAVFPVAGGDVAFGCRFDGAPLGGVATCPGQVRCLPCAGDLDCAPGGRCERGDCTCAATADCAPGDTCEPPQPLTSGFYRLGGSAGVCAPCGSDAQCADGEACEVGSCVAPCTDDASCAARDAARPYCWVSPDPTTLPHCIACRSDASCAPGELCYADTCRPPCDAATCPGTCQADGVCSACSTLRIGP